MLLDDFLIEYWAREETLEGLWHWVSSEDRGVLHLAGPPGSGKSWLLRGLAVSAQERGFIPILVERLPGETPAALIWKLVDHTEFLLDVEAEYLRLLVSQALYSSGPSDAWRAYLNWLGSEMQGSYMILLDGADGKVPSPSDFPEGIYMVCASEVSTESTTYVLDPQSPVNLRELRGFVENRVHSRADEILELSRGNWRYAHHYTQLVDLGAKELPQPENLFPVLMDLLAAKVGKETFRTVHLDILLLLAVAQVPVNSDLLRAWGVNPNQLAFALFDLRGFLNTDGEGSHIEALFNGEHYSLNSADFAEYLRSVPAWRDRLHDAHRRVVLPALDLHSSQWQRSQGSDEEFYALCFLEHHLRESGRTADLNRIAQDTTYPERCWNFSRLARELGYEEISLSLILIAAQKFEPLAAGAAPNNVAQLAEMQAECCAVLTQLGRYADAARWGEKSLSLLQNSGITQDPQYEPLLTHCLLCLADPYLFMGLVEPAREMFSESLQRSKNEQPPDHAKMIHALRGLARSSRALGQIPEALSHGNESLGLARRLTNEEGEEWANYLFDLLMEQCDYLRALTEARQGTDNSPLELMALRWEALRCCREAAQLYERFHWPQDQELAALYLEESMMLFEVEKWAEAEERLSRAITIYKGLTDVHPGEFASLEYLRSQALALMNRIGEASHTLTQLMTPEMLNSLETSERALVLFFRAKVLTHQGQLAESAELLQDAIRLYESALAQGAHELRAELLGARIYLARVLARRGRLAQAQRMCRQAATLVRRVEAASGPPFLEIADLKELEAWIHVHRGEAEEALARCDEAMAALEKVGPNELDTDLETERSVTLITRGLAMQATGDREGALSSCERAIEIETRRAQEGFDSGLMWCALHWGAKAKMLREFGQFEDSLNATREAKARLQGLPANQQAHLGPQIANLLIEEGHALLLLGRGVPALEALDRARILLESEIPQGKEYLVANLMDLYRLWLQVHMLLERTDPRGLKTRWQSFFNILPTMMEAMKKESKSDFLKRALTELAEWAELLSGEELALWESSVPRTFLRLTR